MRGHRHARMAARRRAGLRLAPGRARLGQPEPERTERVDGALLPRNGHARGHDALRRSRDHATAGALRRSRPRPGGAGRAHGCARAALAAGLPASSVLVRADLPEARGEALRRRADPRRRAGLRPRRVSSLASCGTRLHGLARDFPYEYEKRLAIDVINGGERLRKWVDDAAAAPGDLDALVRPQEEAWLAHGG